MARIEKRILEDCFFFFFGLLVVVEGFAVVVVEDKMERGGDALYKDVNKVKEN